METDSTITDEFVNELLLKNIPIELIKYSNGQHSFDEYDNKEDPKEIMFKTIEYLKSQFDR